MECDLLIIGAGASGGTSAVSALEGGVSNVVVVEKSQTRGGGVCKKIDFIEGIGINDTLKKLNLKPNYTSNTSRWYSPSDKCFTLKSEISDLWFTRGDFEDSLDYRLQQSALDMGANLLLNTELVEINEKNTAVVRENGKIKKITAKVIIDAEGVNSVIGKSLNLYSDKKYRRVLGVGVVGWDFNIEAGIPEIFFDQENMPGSYCLLAKNPKDKLCYAVVGFECSDKLFNAKKIFENVLAKKPLIKSRLEGSTFIENIFGELYVAKPTQLVRDNIIITGDSARLMEPFLHYGLREAIVSGYVAGIVSQKFLNQKKDANYLKKYSEEVERILFPKLKRNEIYERCFNNLCNSDIEKVFDFLIKNEGNLDDMSETPYLYLHRLIPFLFKNPNFILNILKAIIREK
jgi:flavin-dependent dehydrogenase